jgi:hypothetical protein
MFFRPLKAAFYCYKINACNGQGRYLKFGQAVCNFFGFTVAQIAFIGYTEHYCKLGITIKK